ncbi:MAG: hypothetical protein NVS2B17_19630 [Candidatus Velthaea sp.]
MREVQLAVDRSEKLQEAYALRSVLVTWAEARRQLHVVQRAAPPQHLADIELRFTYDVTRVLSQVDAGRAVSPALRRRVDADAQSYAVVEGAYLDRQRAVQARDQDALEFEQRTYAVAVVGVMIVLALFSVGPTLRRTSKFLEGLAREDEAEKRRATEQALAAIFEQSRTGVALLDQNGTILQWNAALTNTLGVAGTDPRGASLLRFVLSSDELLSFLDGGSHRFELLFFPAEGKRRVGDASISPVAHLQDGTSSFLLVLEEITERREIEERLQHDASHDSLTNLENRKAMRKRVERALANCAGGYLVLIDLDDFKSINDRDGHSVGDEILIEIADRLRITLSASGTAGRIGGDEFVLLLTGIEESDLTVLLERVLDEIAKPIATSARMLSLTASIGATSLLPTSRRAADDLSVDEAMRAADIALYRAKALGRNRFVIGARDAQTDRDGKAPGPMEIREGLAREEFVLQYQPIVDARIGRCVAVEALVRWNRGELGMLAPGAFIEMAERSGTIVPLGTWVLMRACAEFSAQIALGLSETVNLHVNVSALQIAQDDFVTSVHQALMMANLPASRLVLEITEGTLVRYHAEASNVLDKICALGVRWCIDDFGVGYSSLAYLGVLPVTSIKIDRSFISSKKDERLANGAIVNAVLQLGRSLDIDVIAEGVETAKQGEQLAEMGCHILQGFFFAKPLSASSAHAYGIAREFVPVERPAGEEFAAMASHRRES